MRFYGELILLTLRAEESLWFFIGLVPSSMVKSFHRCRYTDIPTNSKSVLPSPRNYVTPPNFIEYEAAIFDWNVIAMP